MYEIILSKNAHKFYANTNDALVKKLNKAFDDLSQSPYFGDNIKMLKGALDGLYRYRVGAYRIVYSIGSEIKIVSIVWIGTRGDAYKSSN